MHHRVIITCQLFPAYYLLRRVAGAGRRYQEDDEADQQKPAAAAAAGGQSQGGGKRAHRPRGANQPPKPTTDGASTSFPVACTPLPPARPPDLPGAPSRRRCPREKRLTSRSSRVRLPVSVSSPIRGGVINVITTARAALRPHEGMRAHRSTRRGLVVIHQAPEAPHNEKTPIVSGPLETAPPRSLNGPRGARARTEAAAAARGRYSDAAGVAAPRFVLASPSVHATSIECTGLVAVGPSLRRESRDGGCMYVHQFVDQADAVGFPPTPPLPLSSSTPAEILRRVFRKSLREFIRRHHE